MSSNHERSHMNTTDLCPADQAMNLDDLLYAVTSQAIRIERLERLIDQLEDRILDLESYIDRIDAEARFNSLAKRAERYERDDYPF